MARMTGGQIGQHQAAGMQRMSHNDVQATLNKTGGSKASKALAALSVANVGYTGHPVSNFDKTQHELASSLD